METITFKCEVITPMFMGGADRNSVELRPSEFKGMMRFWWRAIKAENNIQKLKEEESKIFGGTGEGEGRSKVLIKIKPLNVSEGEYWPLPHRRNFKKKCFNVGSQFKVELSFKDIDENFFSNLFILTTLLGGFGGRSRRGFGCVQIIEPALPKIGHEYIVNLLSTIQNSYNQRNKIINSKSGGQYPWIKEIEIGKEYENWEDLLIRIGQATHNHRDPSFGNASPRMASPVYVSIIKLGSNYKPIVTTLNSYFPQGYTRWDFNKQNQFKKPILC